MRRELAKGDLPALILAVLGDGPAMATPSPVRSSA